MKALSSLLFLLLSLSLLPAQTVTAPAAPAASSAPAVPAQAEDKTPVLLDTAFLDAESLKKFLGDFPKLHTKKSDADIDTLLALQASRTPEEITRAGSEAKLKPESFASVFGPWFDTKSLPLTDALLKKATHDSKLAYDIAKDAFNRPRPFLSDDRIKPCVELPKSASYPSGHATLGVTWSLLLAELAPDLKKELLARGKEIGKDREIGGVHYPSDVKAGEKLGHELARRFLLNPEFKAELAQAKVELTAARQANAKK